VEKEIASWKSETIAKKITLSEGQYVMTETQAPEGYEVAESITFRITKENKVEIKNGNDWVEQANSTVKMEDAKTPVVPQEPKEKEVVFSKVDVAGKEIAGAKIQIKDEEGKVVKEWTSKEGESETVKLKEGKYKFHEEAAPEGYLEVTDFEFTVDKEGKVKLGEIKEGETVKLENGKVVVTDKNKPVEPDKPNPNIPDNPNPNNPDEPKPNKPDNSDSKTPTEPNEDSMDRLPKTSVANSVGEVLLSMGAVFGAVYAYSKKRR
ncbi:MAG: SpaA isopeptide-forming pilin-related protein, partial [Peptoniphilaceae bacterium]|nr:SpaA isopeptide-forming pilin-related protein [Peptoniphilaceae bacterium]